MPYRSAAQRSWAHSPAGVKALGGPSKVSEWDEASKGMSLPERIHPPRILGNSAIDAHRKRAYQHSKRRP